jgi:hypothetical protein
VRQRAINFCTSVMALLSAACAADKRLVAPHARRRVATFRQRILPDLPHIFTFLATPNVPPTNNFDAACRAVFPDTS